MSPDFDAEKANDLVREVKRLAQYVVRLEKRLDKQADVLRAVFEVVRVELKVEPAALAEKLAGVVREKAGRAAAPCAGCKRPLGDRKKCMYCGTERVSESVFDLL